MIDLCDFFIATVDEALQLDPKKSPLLDFPSLPAQGLGRWHLRELAGVIYEARHGAETADVTWQEPGHETPTPCILCLPPIGGSLRRAHAGQVDSWAATWWKRTGWAEESVPLEGVVSLLQELAAMARDAYAADKSIFLWVCEAEADSA
jgi:hypothetical protein